MWFDGIMTNRSTPVPAFGSVAVMAQEIASTVKRTVKMSALKNDQVNLPIYIESLERAQYK